MTKAESDHVMAAADLVNEAMVHHQDATRAADRGDKHALGLAHSRLGSTLRRAQAAFQRLGQVGAEAASDKSSTIQTSQGVGTGVGVSSPPRQTPGLLTGDVATFLERARIGARGR
jgi:hypothetical protein